MTHLYRIFTPGIDVQADIKAKKAFSVRITWRAVEFQCYYYKS